MNVPPFNIPNLRIDQRKTSSAEDMARKNSTGSISNEIFSHIFPSFCLSYSLMTNIIFYEHQIHIHLFRTFSSSSSSRLFVHDVKFMRSSLLHWKIQLNLIKELV